MANVAAASNDYPPISQVNTLGGHQRMLASSDMVTTPANFVAPVPVASALQGGYLSTAYSESVWAQNGTTPYTFAVTSGALPTGCTLNSSTGVISGTPTLVQTASFTITVTDAHGYTGSQSFSITIAAPSGGGSSAAIYGWSD